MISCCKKVVCCCPCECGEDTDEDEQKKSKKKGFYNQVPDSDDEMEDIVLPDFHKVPLEKVFQFAQPQVPLSIHPQIKNESAIKEQPTAFYPVRVGTMFRRPSQFEDSSFCYSPISKASSAQKFDFGASFPQINFSILHDIQTSSLIVHLMSAENLTGRGKKGIADPNVVLFLLPHREDIFRSKTCYGDVNPIFNETFVFSDILYNEVADRTLVLRIISQNDMIGNVVLPLHKTEFHGVQVSAVINEDTDTEQSSTNGDIQIILRYDPSLSELSGLVVKATNLKKMDVIGLSDPYVEIKVYYKGKRKYKWKSKVKKKTLTPMFNQDFMFDFADLDINDIVVKLVMKDEDFLSKDDFMGIVEFGESVDHPTGRAHWKEIMNRPNIRITRWHSLDQHSVGLCHLLNLRHH